MTGSTSQARRWAGEFGRRYTDRHPETVEGWNDFRLDTYGITQTELAERFLGDLNRGLSVLEVGSNVGVQLRVLRELGFRDLTGIDVNRDALSRSREHAPEIDVIEADVLSLPFPDDAFDLVVASELLITISPEHVGQAIDEIVRCSRRYVWGLEFFADEYVEIPYRGLDEMLWKTDFPELFAKRDGVHEVRSERRPYLEDDNEDVIYLFELDAPHRQQSSDDESA